MADTIRILYVDDESGLLDIGKLFLERGGAFYVATLTSAIEALEQLKTERYDAIISDYQMPDMDGLEFLKQVRLHQGQIPFILFTGRGREEVVIEALNSGADFYLQKGGEPKSQFAELSHKIRQAVNRKRAEEALLRKNEELGASYEQIAAAEEELRANLDDLTRQELAIRESETRYRQFFKTTLDSVFISTPDGKWTDINEAFLETFGYATRDEVLGLPVSSAYAYPEERAVFLKLVERDGYIKEYPMRFKKKDGTIRDGLITIVPIKNPDGSIKEFIGTLRDITEFKNTEKALKYSEAIYQQLEAQLPDFVIIHEGETIVFVNAEGARIVGKTPEQIIGTSVLSYAAPAYHELIKKNTRLRYQGIAIEPYEIEIITQSGEQRRVVVRATQVFNRKSPATLTVLTDITEHKRAEEELRGTYEQLTAQEEELRAQYDMLALNEAEWESTFDAISDWITLITPDGQILRTNKAAESMFGTPTGQIVGMNCFELVHGTECPDDSCPRKRMLGSKKREITEIAMQDGNGWLQVTVDPIINANGDVISAVHIVRDISENAQSQKALMQAKKKLSLLNYVTFNDIQNSVFSLSAYIQIIKDEVTDTRINGFVEKQDDILQKITNSLKFSQSYQDLGIKPPTWQNAKHVFLMAISHLDFLKIKHTVLLEGLEIFADPLLEKVFQILADNTLIHGKNATQVTFGYIHGTESVTLFFEDNGVGIPEDTKKKIFAPDFQKKKGVGLFLAGEILDITGITICETGEPGKGARFEMTVPKGMWRITGNKT